jgi:hypothetical protein
MKIDLDGLTELFQMGTFRKRKRFFERWTL